MKAYTLVTVDHGGDEGYQALYYRGERIAAPDGGGMFTAETLLSALADHTIAVEAEFVQINPEWDQDVDGEWPARLDDFPPEARQA